MGSCSTYHTNTSSLFSDTHLVCFLEQGCDSLALSHIAIDAGTLMVAKRPHLWFQMQGLRSAARRGWQRMEIYLNLSINIDGKEQTSI